MQKTLKRYFPIFVLPTLIAFSFAFIIPFVMGVYLSFCKFKTITNAQFVGLGNYIKIFADKDFVNAFGFTLKFSVVSIVTINVFAFILALALTRKIKGTNLFRTVFFMPNLIGGIILGYIWQQMINAVLLKYETTLVANPTYGFWGLIILMNWQMIGYMMIIYVAGLQNVPTDLIEAAEIDGAGTLRIFFQIIIPIIKPILATVAIFAAVAQWNSFQDTLLLVTDDKLYTLQYVLYNYLNQASSLKSLVNNSSSAEAMAASLAHASTATSIRMTVTIVVVTPIILVYPIFQRFFTKGIMIGAVKG